MTALLLLDYYQNLGQDYEFGVIWWQIRESLVSQGHSEHYMQDLMWQANSTSTSRPARPH